MTLPIPHSSLAVSIRRQRVVVAGLHFIALLLMGLQLYVRTLPATPIPIPEADHAESVWWGLWPVTYAPTWAVSIAVVLIVGWIVIWWIIEWRTHTKPIPNTRSTNVPYAILWISLLLLLLAFYAFPIAHTRWGDAYLLSKAIGWPDPALRLTHSWQAPLDVFLHSQVWLYFHAGMAWEDAIPVYQLLSPLAGLLYLGAAFRLACEQRVAPSWLTFGLLTSLGVLQLFFGYIENYSFAAAGILLYLWLGLRTIAGKTPLWITASALALTHAFHPSTVVLAPSLLYCGWHCLRIPQPKPRNNRQWRAVLLIILSIGLPMLLVGLGVVGLMESGGHGIDVLTSSDRPGGGDARPFVPLWAISTRWEHYTMFSWLHLRDFLQQQLLVAPVVLPSLLLVLIATLAPWYTKSKLDDAQPSAVLRFLLLAAFGYLLFTWVWNPDYGGQRDWDLFSLAAIPTSLLLAATLTKRFSDQRYLQAGTIPLLMLQWLHLAAWVYQNTLPWQWPS